MTEVEKFLSDIENSNKRKDSLELLSILEELSCKNAYLKGSIIGFGKYHYKYESGRDLIVGFTTSLKILSPSFLSL